MLDLFNKKALKEANRKIDELKRKQIEIYAQYVDRIRDVQKKEEELRSFLKQREQELFQLRKNQHQMYVVGDVFKNVEIEDIMFETITITDIVEYPISQPDSANKTAPKTSEHLMTALASMASLLTIAKMMRYQRRISSLDIFALGIAGTAVALDYNRKCKDADSTKNQESSGSPAQQPESYIDLYFEGTVKNETAGRRRSKKPGKQQFVIRADKFSDVLMHRNAGNRQLKRNSRSQSAIWANTSGIRHK